MLNVKNNIVYTYINNLELLFGRKIIFYMQQLRNIEQLN